MPYLIAREPGRVAFTVELKPGFSIGRDEDNVEEALKQAGGNVSEAARLLGVSRIVLRRRIERFGLADKD